MDKKNKIKNHSVAGGTLILLLTNTSREEQSMLGKRSGQRGEKEVVFSGQRSGSWVHLKPYEPTDYRADWGNYVSFRYWVNLSILLECDDRMKCKKFSHHQYNVFGSIKVSPRATHCVS